MVEPWLAKELELTRKHEALILRREAILKGTEKYFDNQDIRSASFIADISKAEERNQSLLKSLHNIKRNSTHENLLPLSPRFETLRKNYWSMVKSVFPVWYEQYSTETSRQRVPVHVGKPVTPGSNLLNLPVTETPNVLQPSPPGTRKTPVTPRTPRDSRVEFDEATITDIPPLDLDFAQGDDPSTSRNVTPHATLETNSSMPAFEKPTKKERRVHYDEAQLSAAANKGSGKGKSKKKSKGNNPNT